VILAFQISLGDPGLHMHNRADIASIHERIHSGNCPDRQSFFMERSNLMNITPSKLSTTVEFAAFVVGAPLPFHVMDIIALTTKKEMLRVNTKSVVALMTDANTFGNFSYKKFPSDTVSQLGFPLKSDRSVPAASSNCADPQMATIRTIDIDFIHESFESRLDAESAPGSPCFHVDNYSSIVRNTQ
jgi:hypothetical protein